MVDKQLSRIAALLRKAESTDNQHEADAYLQAAQRLATLSAVDLAVARSHSADRERRVVPTQRAVEIGPAGRRGLRTFVQLFLAIGRANDLACDIARDSARVFAFGFPTDIDTTEALYSSLVVQMVRACDEHLRSGAHAAETVPRLVPGRGRRPVVEFRPVHASTARINFQAAFAARVGERLLAARTLARQEAVADHREKGVELVLRAKEVEVTDHYRAQSTARGSWGGFRATAGPAELSRRAGDRAGASARLGSEPALGGARRALGSAG